MSSRDAAAAITAALSLVACTAREAPSRSVPAAIEGTSWTLRELDGQRAPGGPSPAATLTFAADGTLYGTSACNRIGGGLRWGPGSIERIRNAPTIVTVVGCRDRPSSEFGGRFWGRVEQTGTWTRDGATLRITFADGSRAGLALIP